MSLGSWIASNKLAAGGIAAGGAFLYLSHKGSGGGNGGDAQGELIPVAAAYDTSTDTSASEAAQAASDSAATAAQAAQDAADAAMNQDTYGIGDFIDAIEQGQTAGVLPPFAATPAPSSVPAAQAAPSPVPSAPSPAIPQPAPAVAVAPPPPPPPPPAAPSTYPLPDGYSAGGTWGGMPPDVHMLIGNILGWKNVGGGSNSNGQYTTFRWFSDLGNTGDWNYYYSGPNKGQWVGPFNFPRHAPGG